MPSVENLVEPAVLAVSRHLRNHGVRTDLELVLIQGDPDIRLVATCPDQDGSVELLAALATDPAPPRWHAVRVRGEDRQVWQGPPHDAPPGEIVDFVEALVLGTGRVPWPRLG